ncbi:MAG TPA: TetR/AcrR family transcriptional regulator [Acidobacteria bacterium]|nr:TetR/AcrR family transcriptional regulator [Acidobacteriota bacterium]
MTPTRRELKAARRRQEILRAAARAFKKKGYYGTTMDDIAAELLMTQGSLYYYFKSKEEILFACHEHSLHCLLTLADQADAAEVSPAARLGALIRASIGVVIDELAASAMTLEFGALSEPYLGTIIGLRDRYEARLRRIIEDGMERGELLPGDPALAGFAILGAINWIARWFDPEGRLPAEAVADRYAELFLRGLGADPARVERIDLPGCG